MSLDVSSNILKTKLKNTILKKGIQGNNPKPEQIAWFKWLNLDGSRQLKTTNDLTAFISDHQFVLMLPSDDSILPDLVSAVKGEIVFISEYPRIAKQYEPLFESLTKNFIQTGKIIEYPLIQSTTVLIDPSVFPVLYHFRNKPDPEDEYEKLIMDLVLREQAVSKRQIRETFRSVPYLFQRIDFYLYKMLADMKLYKTGFDAIEGNIYRFFKDAVEIQAPSGLPSNPVNNILEGMIRSNLFINPVKIQRALKKIFSKEAVDSALKDLIEQNILYKAKVDKETVLVHKELMATLGN